MQAYKKNILKIAELGGAFAFLRHKARYEPKLLMYHRVIDHPLIDAVKPEEFERQMAYLKKKYHVVSMNQLIQELQNDDIQPCTVALTFDDGHFDFYHHAWPVLKKYELPASLYVTTDFVDNKRWLWPDQLKYLLANTTERQLQFEPLGNIAIGSDTVLEAWNDIADILLEMSEEARAEALADIAEQLGITVTGEALAPFRPVTWPELKAMHAEGLDIGAHTVSHAILGRVSDDQLDFELRQSAKRIQEQIGVAPEGICYPNGRKEDVSENVFLKAEAHGYSYGLVAYKQKVSIDRRYQLGRVSPPRDIFEFRWQLARS
ncbi:MAG: hypothetical protein EX270_10010 [Pseudomonadales bacterium]|nr:MAG: hypothetical protein EX270_10010 [Pseudomonadales bacterium]